MNLACLPDLIPAPKEGDSCWVTGWGRLSAGGSSPDILQQVPVPIVGQDRCRRSYPGRIDHTMICAGVDQGGIDACQGDSGGPMVCDSGGKFHLQGVVSWGIGCADPNQYGVYSHVKYFMKWIKAEMAKP